MAGITQNKQKALFLLWYLNKNSRNVVVSRGGNSNNNNNIDDSNKTNQMGALISMWIPKGDFQRAVLVRRPALIRGNTVRPVWINFEDKIFESLIILQKKHRVKSVQMRNLFRSVFSRIWTEYGDLYLDIFRAVKCLHK